MTLAAVPDAFLEDPAPHVGDKIQPNPLLMSNLGQTYELLGKETASVADIAFRGRVPTILRAGPVGLEQQGKHASVFSPQPFDGARHSPLQRSVTPLGPADSP